MQANYSQTRAATAATSDPLIRYVNLTISNPTGAENVYAEVTDQSYDTPIVNNAGQNLCAVVNFSLPMQNMPLFIFPVELNQADENLSTIQVGVCENMNPNYVLAGNVEPATLQSRWTTALDWVPQTMGLPHPAQNSSTMQIVSPYYYCYSFQHFVNLVNAAVQDSWVDAGHPGGDATQLAYCPKFGYDDNLKTFYWQLPSQFTGNVTASSGFSTDRGWTVCWNEDFDNLLNNFNVIENGNIFVLEEAESALMNTNVNGNVVLYQDYPTTDYFNSAERILVTTTSIPVAQDFFPGQQPYGLSARESVLVDVNLDFDNNITAQRSILKYDPQVYQWNDLVSTLPIQRIGVKFRWVDSRNRVYDIPLSKTDTVTCKIGFFNKKLHMDKD